MTVDTYALCPCGNGKKLKFCKCKDSVGELDAVLKLVDGGQVVPALDRLATILQENPDAAWALAIRGRLLLDLREYDSLSENADRFIRLQPSNPLALAQRAAAWLFKGEVEPATTSMLEALTESGRDVDAFVLDMASVLSMSLAQSGAFLTARVYATLAMMATGYEGGQTAVSVLRQLNEEPSISQLMKAIPEPIERPSDASWGERYDEAAGLLQGNQVLLAENKFESLNRTAPQVPAILMGLLTCAIWRGDTEAQSDALKKLSRCEELDFELRTKYLAMSAMALPKGPDISVATVELGCDIDNPDEVQVAMTADPYFCHVPPEMLAGMRTSEDDIPPRAGFQVLDREKPASLEELPTVDQFPDALATIFVYGKQTDREARLQILEVREHDVEQVKSKINQATQGDLNFQQTAGAALPLVLAGQPAIAMLRFKVSPTEGEQLRRDLIADRMPKSMASLKLPILGGASLEELADDDSRKLERVATMKVIEQYDSIALRLGDSMEELYRLAGLEQPETITTTDETIELLNNEDLARVDPAGLGAESLIYLLQRAQQVSSTRALRRFAQALLHADLKEEQSSARLIAYMTLINTLEDVNESLQLLDEAKAFAESKELSTAHLLLAEVGLRLRSSDGPGFQRAVETLSSRHGHEPEVMAQLQQLLMSAGLIGPDGRPRGVPGPAAGQPPAAAAAAPDPGSQGGGIWTPDGGSPPSGPEEGQGGGKIWMPGMD